MRKYLSILLILCLICIFAAGCSDKGMSDAQSNSQEVQMKSSEETADVDVDLTIMSSTMVYAEVYNMMASPNDYVGKTIKMSGPYYASYYGETDMYYHYVTIEDATACCQQGLEFIWSGDHTYPDDYPEDNTQIEVVGVFGSYEELGETYYHLAVNDISILK